MTGLVKIVIIAKNLVMILKYFMSNKYNIILKILPFVFISLSTLIVISKIFIFDGSAVKSTESPKSISVDIAYDYYVDNRALFIDTRNEKEYERLHIKGAVSIPYYFYNSFSNIYKQHYSFYEGIVITYCDNIICGVSGRAARDINKLTSIVYYLHGGIEAWENAGYPLSSH